jgi:hypothetical protein
VSESEFAPFYGEINDRIAPIGFSIDVLSDEGIGPIDLEQIQNETSHGRRVKTKRWMALASSFGFHQRSRVIEADNELIKSCDFFGGVPGQY